MAQLEKFKKSFEVLKLFSTQCQKPAEKTLIPVKYLRQENIDKKECLKHCDILSNILISSNFRNHPNFNKFLSQTIELFFHLCNNDNVDIRNAVNETCDKLIWNLIESNSNCLLSEFCKEIVKPLSQRSLRLSLIKFSEICHRIRPNKYRAFTTNLYTSFVSTIIEFKDELFQEALYQSVCKIYPLLTPYATEKEILNIINAYLSNLSSPSNTIRRFSALSIVALCDSTRKSDYYFDIIFNHISNLILSAKLENKDLFFSGVFMMIKYSFSKICKYIDENDHSKLIDTILRDLSFFYQQMISTIKSATNNILIISTLEALMEFFNTMPPKIFQMFNDLCENDFKSISSPSYSFKIPEKSSDNDSIQNLENINEDLDEKNFQKSCIFFNDTTLNVNDISENENAESTFEENFLDEMFFDPESENDNKSIENKTLEFDISSESSSLNMSHKCLQSPFDSSFDMATENHYSIDFDELNHEELFSFEYCTKLICLKYLLKGQSGQLLTDNVVRVSIKAIALSCISSIVYHYPQILFEKITIKNGSQPIYDIFLYLNHSDPNIRGYLALISGRYLKKALSYLFSYEEFLKENNFSNNVVSLDNLLSLFKKLIFDSSSITVKYALISLQQFFPELLLYSEINIVIVFEIIYNLLSLKQSTYWLIKVELINLFSMFSFKHLKHFEYLLKSSNQLPLTKLSDEFLKSVPLSKLILEEIVFNFLFDNDHRVRQAALNSMSKFIENLCLNNYIFHNDSINLLVLDSMLSNYSFDITPKLFDGNFPSIDVFEYPFDAAFLLNSTDENTDLKNLIIESNISYFVKKFLYELRIKYYSKLSLTSSLNSLSTLAKLYPPSKYLNGWMIESIDSLKNAQNSVEWIYFLIEQLTKNQMIIYDLTLQQNLIELIMSLIEAVCLSCFHTLQNHQNEFKIESSNDFYQIISPNFTKCIEIFFLYLCKIVVIYSAINEDNILIFTSFIHNLHTKNVSISAMIRKSSSSFFEMKEKDIWNKKEVFNKGPKRRETSAYDQISFKLFDILKNHYRHKKTFSSGRNDKTSYLNSILNCFSKILEFTSASFLCNFLEDILIYLKMIFYLNPCSITCIINKLLKCLFEINYISMYIEVFNMESIKIQQYFTKLKSTDFKSFHNICFVIPYMKFNDNFNHSKNSEKSLENMTDDMKLSLYLNWLRKWIKYKHMKIMNSDVTTLDNKTNSICLKKFLATKIQCFEPLVIQSMRHYTLTSDTKFQSRILNLLVHLIQFHINYSLLDSENIFISFIMKQFDYLENIYNTEQFELLMKHIFYFLTTLSCEPYISNELVDIPKVIQLCDNMIANGHQKLAIDGLYIIINHLFYSEHDGVNFTTKDQYQNTLETQREVVLAYCFKLISFSKTFHLLIMILNHYKYNDRTKWNDLSQQIIQILINKLLNNAIKIDSIEYFKSLQSLFSFCSTDFLQFSDSIELMFNEVKSYDTSKILFNHWLPKMLIYLKLILSNLNESDLLSNTDRIKEKINIINLNPNNSAADCFEKINFEDVFAYFLLNLLQKIVMQIDNDLRNNGNSNNRDHEIVVYFLRYYQLILSFIFQSGFYPKLTKSAIYIVKQSKPDISLNNELFDLKTVNDIFLKISKFYPVISISWLNFLYILNYEKLPKILAKCIEQKNNIYNVSTINAEILKRSSLILLCDYLSENLENVEFLSWFIINHLKSIIEHCHEMPIKEFINAIHRKPVSSGLLLQVISSRCDELLSSPIMANKILYCLERSHNRQNIALIMFLLEKYLCNQKFTIYYKCCKYAESIITGRLMSIYDSQHKSVPLFNQEDFNNLLKILKHTSYNKLYFTVKMIRIKFYDSNKQTKHSNTMIKDPLSEKRINVPEIDKNWFIQIMESQMSQRQNNDSSVLNSLDKLSNEDIVNLIFSDQFSMKNFIFVLKLIVEKSSENKSKLTTNFNRKELAKLIIPIYIRFMQSILEKFPLIHYFEKGKPILNNDMELVFQNEFFKNLLLMFLPSFNYFLENLSSFENYSDERTFQIILRLTAIYSTFIYLFENEQNYHYLINITKMIANCLININTYIKLCQKENFHLQLTLINSVYFTFKHHYSVEEINLPIKFHFNEIHGISWESSNCEKLLSLFHSLEKKNISEDRMKERQIPLYQIILENIILMFSRFPLFNSFVYIPFNLFISKNEHIWNGINAPEGTCIIPIISSQFLCDVDTLKQFIFRVANLGFTNRRQFEEIWMTLLGVFSESFSLITQNKHSEELNEYLTLSKLVIIAITNLLYNGDKTLDREHYTEKSGGSSFGTKFELIQEIIEKNFESFDKVSKLYNEPILNRSFIYKFKPIRECKFEIEMEKTPNDSLEQEIASLRNMKSSIDLYSCIQFLMDFFLLQMPTMNKNIYFPIIAEIAKSILIISELFVDKNQYRKSLALFNELQKIVENFEDEILNQYVSAGFCKFYSIMFSTNDDIIEKHKKVIIEKNFREFFLPTRIYAIQGIEYLIESHLIKTKDLQPLLEYIIKHLNAEHTIPSSYCKEYVNKLVNISFILIDSYWETLNNSEHREKIIKCLIKLISKDINIGIVRTLKHRFDQLIRNKKINSEEASLLRNIVLNRISTATTNQSYIIHMLNLIICTSYFVGSTNFDLETQDENNELFKTMEELSILFEPLKWCNSLEANVICQMLGHFLIDFFPAQDILNKCIGECLSKQQNHYKYLINILYIIYSKLQIDCHQNDTGQDWVVLSLSSFTQLVPISHALWALTCFLICASQNHWIRSCYFSFQNRFGKFSEQDKKAFFSICNNFYNEIKTDDNKLAFVKTFQKAACLPNSPYIEVLQYLCDI